MAQAKNRISKKKFQWGPSIDSVAETRGFVPDQWLF